MTTPITTINPSKSKTWVALVGGVLATLVPIVLSLLDYIPAQYAWVAAVINAVIAILQTTGVYTAPYKPEGTSVVSTAELKEIATPAPSLPPDGGYQSPWPKPKP